MIKKPFQVYDFTLAANGTQELRVTGEYFRIQSSSGTLNVTVEGLGTLPNLAAGQGQARTPFSRLILKDTSGAPNTGFILVSGEDFIDNRTYGVNSLDAATIAALIAGKYNNRPEAPTHSVNDNTAAIMGTSVAPLVAVADNPNGLIILDGYLQDFGVVSQCMLAKVSAPIAVVDGQCLLSGCAPGYSSAGAITEKLNQAIYVPAGLGIWLRSDAATLAAAASRRGLRYIKL